jgi:hypothetical protein
VLELGNGGVGVVAKDPVDAPWVESESAQPPLHVGDVVSLQHRTSAVKEPVAQTEAGLNQARPSLASADAVNA